MNPEELDLRLRLFESTVQATAKKSAETSVEKAKLELLRRIRRDFKILLIVLAALGLGTWGALRVWIWDALKNKGLSDLIEQAEAGVEKVQGCVATGKSLLMELETGTIAMTGVVPEDGRVPFPIPGTTHEDWAFYVSIVNAGWARNPKLFEGSALLGFSCQIEDVSDGWLVKAAAPGRQVRSGQTENAVTQHLLGEGVDREAARWIAVRTDFGADCVSSTTSDQE
jgi:hypothetical protein